MELPVSILLLAAGQSSRMGPGGGHKLLAEFAGEALVRRSARAALGSLASSVLVVTGHRRVDILSALGGLDIICVHNAAFETGIASSLSAGISAIEDRSAGALIMLADMPGITANILDSLIHAFRSNKGHAIVRAVANGRPGHPVILPRSLFAGASGLRGDTGARHLIENSGLPIVDVELGEAARYDVDTPEAVLAAGGVLKG